MIHKASKVPAASVGLITILFVMWSPFLEWVEISRGPSSVERSLCARRASRCPRPPRDGSADCPPRLPLKTARRTVRARAACVRHAAQSVDGPSFRRAVPRSYGRCARGDPRSHSQPFSPAAPRYAAGRQGGLRPRHCSGDVYRGFTTESPTESVGLVHQGWTARPPPSLRRQRDEDQDARQGWTPQPPRSQAAGLRAMR